LERRRHKTRAAPCATRREWIFFLPFCLGFFLVTPPPKLANSQSFYKIDRFKLTNSQTSKTRIKLTPWSQSLCHSRGASFCTAADFLEVSLYKRKRKKVFFGLHNRSPRRVHTMLQFENEGGVIEKKLLQILLFRGKTIRKHVLTGADSRLTSHDRPHATGRRAPNSFLSPPTTCLDKHRYK
jgi:hypothetical protein